MKPYYEHDGLAIYHGDCREVLPTLSAESADILVTDPPYGVEWRSNYRKEKFKPIIGDESSKVAFDGLAAALRVLRRSRHGYVFGPFDLSPLKVNKQVELIWDKVIQTAGDLSIPWGSQHEYIQFFIAYKYKNCENGKGGLAARLRQGSVLRFPRIHAGAVKDTCEKPVRLLRELIESSSRIDEMVLDPFMRNGTTLVAAAIEGRKAIGIELEEKYCEMAAKRLENQKMIQFEYETPAPEATKEEK